MGPEEPLCLVAKQPGRVSPASRGSGPAHQPARVHRHLAGGAEDRPAQSQLATSHRLARQVGAKVPCLAPVLCGGVSPGHLLVRTEVTGVSKWPLYSALGVLLPKFSLKGHQEKRNPGS